MTAGTEDRSCSRAPRRVLTQPAGRLGAALGIALLAAGCTTTRGADPIPPEMAQVPLPQPRPAITDAVVVDGVRYVPDDDAGAEQVGVAAWYGPGFHGRKTASGERFDQDLLTAAHRTFDLPSVVKVTNLDNGKTLIVRVNDRGPFTHNRIIDISKRGAELLGFRGAGSAHVRLELMEAKSTVVAARRTLRPGVQLAIAPAARPVSVPPGAAP